MQKQNTLLNEMEHGRDINRRGFLRRVLGGSALITAGAIDAHFTKKRYAESSSEAKKEVEEQGIPQPDQEKLKAAEKFHDINSASYINKHPEKIQQARDVIAQEQKFLSAYSKEVMEKESKIPFNTLRFPGGYIYGFRPTCDAILMGGGALAIVEAVIKNERNRKRQNPERNEEK